MSKAAANIIDGKGAVRVLDTVKRISNEYNNNM
jgi:hypothetical protein